MGIHKEEQELIYSTSSYSCFFLEMTQFLRKAFKTQTFPQAYQVTKDTTDTKVQSDIRKYLLMPQAGIQLGQPSMCSKHLVPTDFFTDSWKLEPDVGR